MRKIQALEPLHARFSRPSDLVKPRNISLNIGEPGSGKTRWALGAPTPLVVFSFDNGTEGVIERELKEGRDIYVQRYQWAPGGPRFTQEYAQHIRDTFVDDYYYALDHARSIVVDKESDMYEVFRYAEWGGPTSGRPKDFAQLYTRLFALVEAVKERDLNAVYIQSLKGVWAMIGGKFAKTGEREPVGCDRLHEWVYTTIFHRREIEELAHKDGSVTKRAKFFTDVGKCRQNTTMQEQTYEYELGAFEYKEFGRTLIEDSEEGDWI